MSRHRDVENKLRSLADIRDILSAMKNTARMEVHRLDRMLATQRRVVESIEAAAADFRAFHGNLFPAHEPYTRVSLLVGSERGFCGHFNESLLDALAKQPGPNRDARLVVLGSKLGSKLPDALREATVLEGASVVDEVEKVLLRLMNALGAKQADHGDAGALQVTVIHHRSIEEGVRVSLLHPFPETPAQLPRFSHAAQLYTDLAAFVNGLTEHYLFARLHELLYGSLLVENQVRVAHLESAVQRMERTAAELMRKRNRLRQEEITEEIEVIMLSDELTA